MYDGKAPAAGVITGLARVDGRLFMVIANDATVASGAFFPMTCKKIIRAQMIAEMARLPLLYLVDSAGVFLPLQDEIFPDEDDFGRIFRNNAVISAMGIPQIAAIMGNCVAGGAYLRCVTYPEEEPVEMSGRLRILPTFILQGKNITFRGRGIIDQESIPRADRRYTILIQDSEDVTLEGVTILDPSHWTVPIKRSDKIHVDNIKIIGRRGNADGVDISSDW